MFLLYRALSMRMDDLVCADVCEYMSLEWDPASSFYSLQGEAMDTYVCALALGS
jgi:hypothetical protein